MSTKTSIKRVALVAVSALGFGLLSVMPAKAEGATDAISGFVVAQNGNRASIESAVYVKAIPNSSTANGDDFTVEAALTAKPAGSTLDLGVGEMTFADAEISITGAGASGLSETIEGLWTPDLPGSYRFVIWNDNDGGADRDAGERATTITIEVVADDAPISAALTVKNATSIEDGDYGVAATVAITNSKGVPTRLGAFESLSITASGDAEISVSDDNAGAATALDAADVDTLTQGDFSKGIAYLNILNDTAQSVILTLQGESGTASAGIRKTTTLTFKTEGAVDLQTCTLDNDGAGAASANALDLDGGSVAVPQRSAASATYTCEADGADASFGRVTIEDTSAVAGSLLGAAGYGYDLAVAVADEEASFSVAMVGLETLTQYTVSTDTDSWTMDPAAPAADALAPVNAITAYRVLDGSSLTLVLKMVDQFGSAIANESVAVTVSGRNSKTATLVTDASGLISYTYTDTVGAAGNLSSDVISFDGAADADVTVTYVSSLGVSTVTLSYPGEDDTVAGTTTTDISAAAGGATGSSASIIATVKDENGSILVGVPVTFAVSGLTGAEVHTNLATVITGATGTATGKVSSYAAGKATVTVTAAGKSATADIYFKQQSADEARTISATASNGIVTATVKDRYGNPIKDVTVKATRSGTGFFGSGSSSAEGSTDKNGVVDFYFNGTGTVTVGFDGDEYGQSADAAGKVGTTAVTASAAGTALVAQKGLGASLAPAGVNSVTLSVEGTSAATEAATAAADAAAEAIDAANAATDAANLAAEAADAATVAAEEARDAADAATAAVEELATQVATLMAALKAQITTLANTVAKIAKKVKA